MSVFETKLAYIYSDLPAYVRVNKTLPVLRDLFREVHFIGCARSRTWDGSRTEGVRYHIEDRRLPHGPRSALGLFGFVSYIRRVLREVRPEVVVCVNDELALAFALGLLPRPKVLVVDMFDSFAMRIIGPARHLNPLWRKLSEFSLKRIDGLVEVCEERLAWHRQLPGKTTIIYNSPPLMENVQPMEGLPENFVYVNGTLDDHIHGVETILAAVEQVDEMRIVTTGKPIGAFVREVFLKHPKVTNLGKVPPGDIFRILAASKAVYAHYLPRSLVYVLGAPNKLYEAMMLGKPVLINSENLARKMPEEIGFALVSPYGEVNALTEQLRRLLDDEANLSKAGERAKRVFRETYSWDLMAARWEELFSSLAG